MKYEYFIGLRYLKAKRRQTFVSVITLISVTGVAVGVAALVVVLSGMDGVKDYMRDKILGFNAHIMVRGFGGIRDPEEVVEKLLKVPHVTGASPFIEDEVMIKGNLASQGALIRGVDPGSVEKVMSFGPETIRGGSLSALASGEGVPGIAIGEELASELGAGLGDEVILIIPEGRLSPIGMAPLFKRFKVVCVYSFGFYQVDSQVALIGIDEARRLFKRDGMVDAVEVKTDDIFAAARIQDEVDSALGSLYITETWYDRQRQLFAALEMERALSGLVLSLIMVVAGFNIVSMLLMLIMEKYRDIAILKSMGADDFSIMKIFITQGSLIGTLGTVLGLVLGLAVCWVQLRFEILKFDAAVYQFSVVPMKITAGNLLGVGAGALLLSFLTTLYPSWQAARMKPAESLRYE